jgi:hypothetical protein
MRLILVVLIAVVIGLFQMQKVSAADIGLTGNVSVSGTLNATAFTGDGSGLSNISGTSISNTSVTVNQLADDAVSTIKLINAAVTPAKISFYENVAIVAVNGGDYNNPATAMSNYQSWCPNLSATNPCLLKIMPGVYNVGSSPVVMQPYIDIEGSGEKITKITGAISASQPPTAGTVLGASNAEIRFLTVENIGPANETVAIMNSSASPSIIRVTAKASGGTFISIGVINNSSSPGMSNVTVLASGESETIGVFNKSSSPSMTNITVIASGGSQQNCAIVNSASSPVMTNVMATALAGGTGSNYGVSNASSSSPVMSLVTATASGAMVNTGIQNSSSSPTMTNVTSAASGNTSYGVSNSFSSPLMTNVTATASGTTSYGVFNISSSPVMTNVTTTASGTTSYGVLNDSGTVKINNSIISGTTYTILNNSGVTLVGNTQLNGGVVANYGTLSCVMAYSGNYLALGADCQ